MKLLSVPESKLAATTKRVTLSAHIRSLSSRFLVHSLGAKTAEEFDSVNEEKVCMKLVGNPGLGYSFL